MVGKFTNWGGGGVAAQAKKTPRADSQPNLPRLIRLVRVARLLFLGGGVVFFLWEMGEIWWLGEGFGLRAALEIALISVIGPAFAWFASKSTETLARQAQQRQRELLALNHMLQEVLAERIPLLGEVIETGRHLQVLHRVSEVMGQGLSVGQTADRVLDKILEVLGLEVGEVWLLNPFRGELELTTHRGALPEAFHEKTRLLLGEGFPGLAAQTGKPVFTSDLAHAPRFLRRAVVEAGFTYFAAVPLFSGERVTGAMTVGSRTRRAPQERELETLISLGRMLAPLMEVLGGGGVAPRKINHSLDQPTACSFCILAPTPHLDSALPRHHNGAEVPPQL